MSEELKYDAALPLYISPGKRFSMDHADKALDQAYSKDRPVVIYIHGRAKDIGEPIKSEKENIYGELEEYGVSVIGFTWDADDGGYDETRPIDSASDFDRFLGVLGNYFSPGNGLDKRKPSLIAHSMGNVIVAELAKEDKLTSEKGNLFTNLILTAPAVKSKRHHKWLRKIGLSERSYVMVNPDDVVLNFAGFLFKPNMLGKEIKPPGVPAEHTSYIHLGELNVNHRYFVAPGQNKQKNLNEFFTQALTGQPVNLDLLCSRKEIDGVGVFSIKPN